jgi:hypothetical protein
MIDLCSFDSALHLSEFIKSNRIGKTKVVLDFVPATEKHKLLVFAFLIDAPAPGVAVRSRVFAEMRSTCFEDTIELVFLAGLDKVPTYTKDRCIQGDTV